MVGALNPNRVVDQFIRNVQTSRERHADVYAAIQQSEKNNLALRKSLTFDFAFRIGAEWELFQHRWHIAAISRKPAVFVSCVQGDLDDGLKRAGAARHILESVWTNATTVPAALNADLIGELVDPEGYNVTFKDGEAWASKAARHLSPEYADRVRGLVSDPEQESLIALIKSIRNVIAHGSSGSLHQLNDHVVRRPDNKRIGLVGAANEPLVRSGNTRVRDIDTYLHGWVPSVKSRRAIILAQRISEVADRLRVP